MNKKNDVVCPFCEAARGQQIEVEYGSVLAIRDRHPVTKGHHLVISKRHVCDYFNLTYNEKRDVESLLSLLRRQILENDPKVLGFNVGMNCGEVAGQSVMHAHIHLIPRRAGDVEEPRGGVRGCVPGKMGY